MKHAGTATIEVKFDVLGNLARELRKAADALYPLTLPNLPDIEDVATKVHEAWIEAKKAQGVTARPSEWGEEQMVPYADLSERAKELDRSTVRAVYEAIIATKPHPVDTRYCAIHGHHGDHHTQDCPTDDASIPATYTDADGEAQVTA